MSKIIEEKLRMIYDDWICENFRFIKDTKFIYCCKYCNHIKVKDKCINGYDSNNRFRIFSSIYLCEKWEPNEGILMYLNRENLGKEVYGKFLKMIDKRRDDK